MQTTDNFPIWRTAEVIFYLTHRQPKAETQNNLHRSLVVYQRN